MKISFSSRDWITMTELEPLAPRVYFADAGRAPYEALSACLLALATVGCPHWITYGTLLGWIREGRFLPHDFDIDFAVLGGTDPARVIEAMAAQGMRRIQESISGRRGVVNQKFVAPSGTMIDIFYLFPEGDVLVDEYKMVGHSLANSNHPRQSVRFVQFSGLDVPVPVPEDPAAYLSYQFGADWRQPVTQWDWVFSPPNVRLRLRPADLPILIARWCLYRYRQLRDLFKVARSRAVS